MNGAYDGVGETDGGEDILELWREWGVSLDSKVWVRRRGIHLVDKGNELLIHGEAVNGENM